MSKQKVKMKYNIINKIEEIKESDMHFENVIKVNDHEYITVLSAYQLAELYDDENIVYMTSSQRGTKIVRNEEIPISSTKNIKEMMDLIKEDSLCTSYITLGSPEGNVEYTEDNLNVKSQLFILDGWNRLSSVYSILPSAVPSVIYEVHRESSLISSIISFIFLVDDIGISSFLTILVPL